MLRRLLAVARTRGGQVTESLALLLLFFVPFLLSSPGRVSADSNQYLYLDPAAFLARVPYLWDPQVGAGTVPHQHIGYLWPMGPWFWAFDALGVPDWIAQRLWLGTITALAGFGARWFVRHLGVGRTAGLVAAVVYGLTPYQLAFTARISVLLLPWAGLPWLLGLTDRAIRRGGWRDPAAIALVVLSIGAVNASSLLLVGVAPLLWLLLSPRPPTAARRLGVVARVGVLTAGTCCWWIVALHLQGAYGMPVLQLTENVETVSALSSPSAVLRGLGDWFFFGRDRIGFAIDQADDYLHSTPTAFFTTALAALGVAAGLLVRWRHRRTFVALVVVGTVVAVGAYPFDDQSFYGRFVVDAMDRSSSALALRNSTRAIPVVVLGLAGLVAAAVQAVRDQARRVAAGGVAVVLALGGLLPVWRTGFLADRVDRDESIPSYWDDAAAAVDAAGDGTRVLELPGAPFATYRWGNTVDSVLVGLTDRPQLAREVLPYGSPASALLLDAIDRRVQEGTFEPSALTPVARLFGIGDVLVRSDLAFERAGTPEPEQVWAELTAPAVPGLAAPVPFGEPVPNVAPAGLARLDESDLASDAPTAVPPPVAIFPVEDPLPIVRTGAAAGPVLIGGDGDGIVDSAAAGLLDGDAAVFEVAALDDDALASVLDGGADLVLTDTNRRRIQTWFYALRDTRGPTEGAGETEVEPTGYDFRLDPFDHSGDDSRTVVEQVGGRVTANGGGGAARPEDRAVAAFDGDLRTSWRGGGADPTGLRLSLVTEEPEHTGQLTLVQPLDGPRDRAVERVQVSFDSERPFDVVLGPESLTPDGQTITFPARDISRVDLRITGVTTPPFDPALANAVGFAEVRLGEVRVHEQVRLPVDLLERARSDGNRLDVVLTRLRRDPSERGRLDDELSLVRVFTLPEARNFGLAGTIRVEPNADDPVLDDVLGTDVGGGVADSSSHLAGDAGSRASRALDADPASAWQAAIGMQEGQFLRVEVPAGTDGSPLRAEFLADGRHSVPARVRVEADGEVVGSADVPVPSGPTVAVDLPTPPAGARVVQLIVTAVVPVPTSPDDPNPAETLPVAVATLAGSGLPVAVDGARPIDRCRPLLEIDGRPVAVRAVGDAGADRDGWTLEPCDGEVPLGAGEHAVRSAIGLDVGLDVDRVVLSSDPAGRPDGIAARGVRRDESGATVGVLDHRPTSMDLSVTTDGEPFWLVLGESDSSGWELEVDAAEIGPRTLVDGYANGWLITPEAAGTLTASLEWVPQQEVWLGMVISALAIALCLFLLVFPRTVPSIAGVAHEEPTVAGPPNGARPLLIGTTGFTAAFVGVAALYFTTPLAALAAVAAVVAGGLVGPASWVTAGVAVAAVVGSRALDEPLLAWVAPVLLAADVVVSELRRRSGR